MQIIVKAWNDVVAKVQEKDGLIHFSLSPHNPLNFSPIKLKEKGINYEFSHLTFQHGLAGMISDSLPGIYGKAYLDEFFMKHFNFRPNTLETLQFLAQNTMGALTYEPELTQSKNSRVNVIFDAQELYAQTKKALLGEAKLSINEVIALSNSAASGARPKAIVGFNKESKKIFIGAKYKELPKGFVHAIVKFDNLLYANPLANISHIQNTSHTKGEYLYYLCAKELGITMANSYLLEANGNYHFVSERFDIGIKNSEVVRKHMHSLSGIMHHNPAETTFDYTNLFRVAEALNTPHTDKVQFFKIMLFNLIFGNSDDHTKNFSYLMDSNGIWRGAPAYDLTFSTNIKHQMLFDYKPASSLTKENIYTIASSFNIKNPSEIIKQMMEVKHDFLYALAKEYDMLEWYKRVINSTKNILIS